MNYLFNDPQIKHKRQFLRNNLTKLEKIFWKSIRNRLCLSIKFRRQCSIGPYIVDFFSYSKKLVIEIDGDSHFIGNAEKYDDKRTKFLESQGLFVLRFTNEEVQNNLEGCLEKLINILENTPPNLP